MTKQVRNIVIMLCIVAVLVSAWLFVTYSPVLKSKTSASSSSLTTTLFKTDSSKINKLVVKNKNGNYTVEKSGSAWKVDEIPAGVPISSSVINAALYDASDIEAVKVIQKDASDAQIKQYGLTNPQGTVSVTYSGTKNYAFNIGGAAPTGGGYYVAAAGSRDVYLVTTELDDYMLAKFTKFVDTSIVSVDSTNEGPYISDFRFGGSKGTPFDIMQLETSATASEIRISNYKFTYPVDYFADGTKVQGFYSPLVSLNAYDIASLDVSGASLKKYGLLNPPYTYSYTLKGVTTTLLFGNTMTDSGTQYVYMMLKGRNVIYRMTLTSVTGIYAVNYTDVVARTLEMPFIDTVKTLTVTQGSQKWVFSLNGGSGDKLVVSCNGQTLNQAYFRDLYQVMVGLQYENTASKPSGAGAPDYSIRFDYRTGKKSDVMNFYGINATNYFWEINNQGQFYVFKSNLDQIINDIQKVISGKDVVSY